jgi:GTPase SAR1 family protein
MASGDFPLHVLQSADQVQLLNDIDKLRSDGVQYHDISLPQLVVCGDQSSGKSSVLEALSNVKFPIDKGTCTRFAMELALRRSPDKKTTAKITPGRNASADRQRRLADFKTSDVGLAGVPELIEKARAAMGLSGDHAICDDVLRLEITGPDLPHLTLVDLPGLIADAKDTKDIELVETMVKTYMKNPRSIILAIVSAQNDKQNQKVLRLAREFDPSGDRTVGIITKPDTLKNYRGSVAERTYLDMAKNQDPVSKLRLGWHVVRNPDYHEKQKDSTYNRDEKETEIFSQEPWNELSKWQLGIGSLRDELTKHLFNQICSELPRVVKDIEREEAKCEQELKDLGEVRATSKDQRKYLIGVSRRFEQLIGTGLEGHWTSDPIFNTESMRLRAQIRNLNDAFERMMKVQGHTFEYTPSSHHRSRESLSLYLNTDPVVKNRAHLLRKVDKILKSGRGQELPGMFDPILVSDIFREQSQNWQILARQHAEKIWHITNQFLQDLLFKIAPARTSTAEAVLNGIVSSEMLYRKKMLDAKISELLLPYIKNLPFCTSSRMAASLKQIDLEDTDTERGRSPHAKVDVLVDNEIDIDACSMLLRYSQAYYNIARDTFVDNVATLAIENCLLAGLASIFSSDTILDMDDGQLGNLAGESEKILSDRKYAEEKSQLLKKSLETCSIHMSRRPIMREDTHRGLAEELAGFSISSDLNPVITGLFGAPAATGNRTAVPHKSLFGDAPLFSVFGKPASGYGNSLFGGPATAGTSKSSTGLFAMPASVNSPAPTTGPFGSGTAANPGLFAMPASVNSPAPTTGPFGSGTAASPGLFVVSSQSDTSDAGAQKPSFSFGGVALSPNPAVKDDAPSRRSPGATQGAPSTAPTVMPTSQLTHSSSGKSLAPRD